MRRLIVLAAAATLALAVASADAASPGFRYGVAAGEIRSKSAVLWTRAPGQGGLSIVLVPDGLGISQRAVIGLRPRAGLTVAAHVTRLEPATRYRFVFEQGKTKSATGMFVTAPAPDTPSTIRFGISGDADATPASDGKPAFNTFGVYARSAGTAIGALFFKPSPPNGMGMRCAALDTYSYAQGTVSARHLMVAMKDAKGRPVTEATGYACPPLVLTAR